MLDLRAFGKTSKLRNHVDWWRRVERRCIKLCNCRLFGISPIPLIIYVLNKANKCVGLWTRYVTPWLPCALLPVDSSFYMMEARIFNENNTILPALSPSLTFKVILRAVMFKWCISPKDKTIKCYNHFKGLLGFFEKFMEGAEIQKPLNAW